MLLKGRSLGFSVVPQHGETLTGQRRKTENNGLKISIRKTGQTE